MPGSRALIYTEVPAGGSDRQWLDRITPGPAVVTGIKWSTQYPGGDISFSAALNAQPNLVHHGLTAGRRVTILGGCAVRWQGVLDEPRRGNPWQLSGTGLAALAKQYGSVGNTAVGSAIALNTIVDNAIARGLPWTRPAALPSAGASTASGQTVDGAFAEVSKANGQFWSLSVLGAVTMAAPPTTPMYLLATTQALNPTMVGYATQVVVAFNNSSGPNIDQRTVTDATAIAAFGKREALLDLTGNGTMSATAATAYGTTWLTQNKPQLRYTNPILVQPKQLTVPGGGPVDLMTVRAGCLVTVTDVDPTHENQLAAGPLSFLVGQTDYDADAHTLTLTPLGVQGTDFVSVLYGAVGGAL